MAGFQGKFTKIATAIGVAGIIGSALVFLFQEGHRVAEPPTAVQAVPPVQRKPVPAVREKQAQTPLRAALPAKPVLPPKGLSPQPQGRPELQLDHLAGTLRVAIPGMAKGTRLPLEHSCYRKNQSPPFAWSGAPAGTKSLVAVLERRQAGKPAAWIWLVYDIDPKEGSMGGGVPRSPDLPGGARHALNTYGKAEYTGPCEPRGQIPYALRLFALDTAIDLPAGISRAQLIQAMNGHIIDAAEFPVVHYLRF